MLNTDSVAVGNIPVATTVIGAGAIGFLRLIEQINSVFGSMVIFVTLISGIITCLKYWSEKKKADMETVRIHIENKQLELNNHERQLILNSQKTKMELEQAATEIIKIISTTIVVKKNEIDLDK